VNVDVLWPRPVFSIHFEEAGGAVAPVDQARALRKESAGDAATFGISASRTVWDARKVGRQARRVKASATGVVGSTITDPSREQMT